ncbi:MAG: YraN family protein [Giesbergeria sp.]|uniref:YraN family protein n=1 Tax=Giesbergeria sp. TaxID=2818473 RepID=UPI002618B8FB|nr:YraN family protein [Giesbergeria sp.]MDD2609306.1 YraN family protein [Giesbergeria sp.]
MEFLGKKSTATARPTAQQKGQAAEDRALAHLQAAGLQLLVRNYRTPGRGGGEIDLIVRAPDGTVVFVEVRSRGRRDFGSAGASINLAKQRRIIFAARHYLMHLAAPPPCRFDAVLLDGDGDQLEWIRAAFHVG